MSATTADPLVTIKYVAEDGGWWADSPELPSLFCGAERFEDATRLARQVVEEELGEAMSILHLLPSRFMSSSETFGTEVEHVGLTPHQSHREAVGASQ